jgi:hypothetical protein
MRTLRRTFATVALPWALLFMLAGAASAQADITITSPVADGYTNNRSPVVTFTGAAANADVTLEVSGANGSDFGAGHADGNGDGTVTTAADITVPPMDTDQDGNPIGHRYALTVRDGSTPLGMVTANIDQAPSISGTTGNGPYAAAAVYFDASSAIPDHDVNLYIDGSADKTVTADSDGNFYDDIVPTAALLTAGPHTAYLTSMDADGVESSPGETVNFNVAPAAPTYADLFTTARLNQSTPAVHIAGVDPSATQVTLSEVQDINGVGTVVPIGSTTTIDAAHGTATVTPSAPLADGLHALDIAQTVNGIDSVDDALVDIDILTSAPVLETSFPGTLTNDNTPYFDASNTLLNGTDNHTFARLYLDGQLVGQSNPAFGGGDSSAQANAAIPDGAHGAYMVTVDDLGHESAVHSNTVAFTVDTVGPAAPNVTSPANGSTTASSTPTVTVTTEPGTTVHVLVDDVGEESDATADGNGNATFTLTQALAYGPHTLHVFSRDAAGNYGDFATTTFTELTGKPPVTPTPPVTTPTPTAPTTDPDGDGITNSWLIGGKAAPAPGTPKAKVSAGKVELKLTAAPKGATKVRVYRADGKGAYKLVKTLTAKTKTFTDKKVNAGHTYKYKTVGVNAKGQQSKASTTATAKVKKK